MKQEVQNFKRYLTNIIQMDDINFDLCVDFLNIIEVNKGEYCPNLIESTE